MQKRHTILGAILILIIIGCATASFLAWRQQQLAALVATSVPEIPDLSRWPDALSREIRDATAKARSGSDLVGSLGHLANLYLANSYVIQAKSPLAALCRLEPSNAQWRYLLADAQVRLGETNAAEADFQKTTVLDPKYAKAWIRLGLLRTQRGAVTEAHECYVTAAATDPDDLMSIFLLMEFESRNGGGTDVQRRLEDFSRAHPDFKDPYVLLAELAAAAGNEAAAAKERRAALTAPRRLPNKDPWIDGLAQFCFDADHLRELSSDAFSQSRLDVAENLLKRAIQIAPKDPMLRDALYSVYEKMGRPADAFQTLQQALTECPDDPNLHVQLSRLLCSLHRPDDAVALIQQAVQRWPANAELHAALGFALSNAGKNDQAVAELQEAIRLEPTLVEERFNLAVGLLNLGQRDAARAAAQKALEMRPDYTDAMTLLGVLALEDKNLAAAEPTVNRLYALQPDDPKSQSLFCGLQLLEGMEAERSGNFAEAEKSYRSGLAVDPNYWRLLRAKGLLAIRQGHFPDAVESFCVYVHSQPEQTEAYFMLGEALLKAGQVDEGRKVLQQGLSLEQQSGANSSKIEAFKHALESTP
jgi:tetratricopeptide (TPR) repeat protein